jgi:uncharacterized protein (TIGR02246 family)
MSHTSSNLVAAMAMVGALLVAGRCPGQDRPADEAMKLAAKLTDEGAATFSKGDAKAMAASYTEDALVFLQGKNDSQHSVKEYDGRAEIEAFYADYFKEHREIRAKNTVEYARFLADDILVIAGTFEPNQLDEKPMKLPFYQVRVKQGDRWLIHSLRFFVLPAN